MGKRTFISLTSLKLFFENQTFKIWFFLQTLLRKPLKSWLYYRVLKQKEEKARLSERWGESQYNRNVFKDPNRPLLWFHAASVGETSSILELATYLSVQKDYNILLTTVTLSSAALVSKHLLENPNLSIFHQYAPLDVPSWVQDFLKNWCPSGAVFVESELWPVRLKMCKDNAIPTILIGARLSHFSSKCWKYFPFFLSIILSCFSWISAKDPENEKRLRYFNKNVPFLFPLDLKFFKAPLFFDKKKSAFLKKYFENKKIFLAVSTHTGEEEFFLQAKGQIKNTDDWLFIIAPRHPERAGKISHSLENAPLRTHKKYPEKSDNFWIIDTIGELGLFFSIADCAFVGGSLYPKGKGHNPYEPLQFNLKTSVGKYHANWTETYFSLKDKVTTITNISDFIRWIEDTSVSSLKVTNYAPMKNELIKMATLIDQTVLQAK